MELTAPNCVEHNYVEEFDKEFFGVSVIVDQWEWDMSVNNIPTWSAVEDLRSKLFTAIGNIRVLQNARMLSVFANRYIQRTKELTKSASDAQILKRANALIDIYNVCNVYRDGLIR